MGEQSIFLGGMPYGPEVKKLEEAFPVPLLVEGKKILHEQLEGILDLKRGSKRYYPIVNSWIKRRKNENAIVIVWEPKHGIAVLGPGEIMHVAETRTIQKLKQTGRAVRLYQYVDRKRLDAIGQQRLDHQLRMAAAIAESAARSKRDLASELAPVKSLPRAPVEIDKGSTRAS